MKFQVTRPSLGAVSVKAPCRGAVKGPESPAFPGEFEWHVEFDSLEALLRFVEENDGGVGIFTPEEGETHPILEIFEEDEV